MNDPEDASDEEVPEDSSDEEEIIQKPKRQKPQEGAKKNKKADGNANNAKKNAEKKQKEKQKEEKKKEEKQKEEKAKKKAEEEKQKEEKQKEEKQKAEKAKKKAEEEKQKEEKEKKQRKREKKAAARAAAAQAAAVIEAAAAKAAAAEYAAERAAFAEHVAEATGTEGEKKEKKKYMRLMLDWRPEFPPEQIHTMTLDQMKAELAADDSDGELIDSDAEEEKYEYQGEWYTGASIITKFNAEASKAHERFDAHLKKLEGKEGGKAGDKAANSVPRARGRKTKIDQWQKFLHTMRTKMSASIYKKYCEHKEIDRDMPVKFKTMQGDHVLKVLEISDADEAARWGKLGPVQEGMVEGEHYY